MDYDCENFFINQPKEDIDSLLVGCPKEFIEDVWKYRDHLENGTEFSQDRRYEDLPLLVTGLSLMWWEPISLELWRSGYEDGPERWVVLPTVVDFSGLRMIISFGLHEESPSIASIRIPVNSAQEHGRKPSAERSNLFPVYECPNSSSDKKVTQAH